MDFYDPTSEAKNNEEAASEIFEKLVDHSKDRPCEFYMTDIGYIFFSDKLLISFCVKSECRTKENLKMFGDLIKEKLGEHFKCFLFSKNTRAINYLERIGMKKEKVNNLVTLLTL